MLANIRKSASAWKKRVASLFHIFVVVAASRLFFHLLQEHCLIQPPLHVVGVHQKPPLVRQEVLHCLDKKQNETFEETK